MPALPVDQQRESKLIVAERWVKQVTDQRQRLISAGVQAPRELGRRGPDAHAPHDAGGESGAQIRLADVALHEIHQTRSEGVFEVAPFDGSRIEGIEVVQADGPLSLSRQPVEQVRRGEVAYDGPALLAHLM